MRRIYHFALVLLFAAYVGILFYSGRLDFYVHPRYSVFGYVMAIVAGAFACMGIVRALEQRLYRQKQLRLRLIDVAASGFLLLALAIGLVLPPRPLSSYTATQRGIDFNSLRGAAEKSTADLFIQNTAAYTLGDWVISINANPDPTQYVDKQVNVTGFVFDREQDANVFTVARFVVTCCAVDARPVGLAVQKPGWEASFGENTWVQVQGMFKLQGQGEQAQLVVVPTSIEKITTPDDPYIY